MLSRADYLQLLPKTELHCHFTATMSADLFVRLAARYGVALPTTDPARLFDYRDLRDFLDAAGAARISLAGIDAAFCDDNDKARLRAQFRAQIAALDALHEED